VDEEVLALLGIVLIGAAALVGVAFSPVARALAERIRGRSWGAGRVRDPGGELEETVDDLKRDVEELGRQLHFMEKLLAKRREPGRLGPGDVTR
jgi:hypothetical protein